MSLRIRATQFSFVRRHGNGVRGVGLLVVEDVGHGFGVLVVQRARHEQGHSHRGSEREGVRRAPGGPRAPLLLDLQGDRLQDGRLRGDGEVEADGAVLQDLGLALVLVHHFQAARLGLLQDVSHA
jgi:hypothetical protein